MPSFVSVPAVHSIFGVFLFILAKIYVVNYMFNYDINIQKKFEILVLISIFVDRIYNSLSL